MITVDVREYAIISSSGMWEVGAPHFPLSSSGVRSPKALQLADQMHDRRLIDGVKHILGDLARSEKDFEEAIRLLENAVEMAKGLDLEYLVPISLFKLAMVSLSKRDPVKAESLFSGALALAEQHQNRPLVSRCLAGHGAAAIIRGNAEQAVQILSAMLLYIEREGYPLSEIDRADFERLLGEAQIRLPQDSFKDAWETGLRLSVDDVKDILGTVLTL